MVANVENAVIGLKGANFLRGIDLVFFSANYASGDRGNRAFPTVARRCTSPLCSSVCQRRVARSKMKTAGIASHDDKLILPRTVS